MTPRNPHPQYLVPDYEPYWRLEHDRLAVDACGDGIGRADFEIRSRPFGPGPRWDRRSGLTVCRWRSHYRHTQHARVDPRPRSRADGPAEPVRVVGHQQDRGRPLLCPIRLRPTETWAFAVGSQHIGGDVEERADLLAPIVGSPDRLRVQPERHIVDEHPAVGFAEIGFELRSVDERVKGAYHVGAVDAEVKGEVIAGAGRNAGSSCSAAMPAATTCKPSPSAIATASAPRAIPSRF